MSKAERARKARIEKRRAVKKAMAPEEVTVLSNIQSLIGELMQMNEGGASPVVEDPSEQPPVMMAEEVAEEDEVEKGLLSTESDSSTASDDAETRMSETETELSEESVNEVSKALMKILGMKSVKKSVKKLTPMEQLLEKIVSVQKSNSSEVRNMTTAFTHLLNGLGLADQVKISKAAEKKEVPSLGSDNNAVLKHIADLIKVNKSQELEEEGVVKNSLYNNRTNSSLVRKNLGNRNVLQGMIGQ